MNKKKENLSHIKYIREMLVKWTVSGTLTQANIATAFQKTLSRYLRQTSKEDLTEVYFLQGMNFPEKVIVRE